MTKLPRRLLNEACIDDNPNALPIVSAKGRRRYDDGRYGVDRRRRRLF